MRIPAQSAVAQVLDDTAGLLGFLAGSSAAAVWYDKPEAYSDVDVFVPNPLMYAAFAERLLNRGWELDERNEKMLRRHLEIGFKNWHTNSLKLTKSLSLSAAVEPVEINVIYKQVDGHPTTKLSQVLESFDFGLLSMGYDTKDGAFKDMRGYMFPDIGTIGPTTPLPLIDYRKTAFEKGLMSEHIMQRTPGRYARYAYAYEYDLSLVKPVLVQGYFQYASYKANRTKPEDLLLGELAAALAEYIRDDKFVELLEFQRTLPTMDGLDAILASLE
jgi:hypothetical protein